MVAPKVLSYAARKMLKEKIKNWANKRSKLLKEAETYNQEMRVWQDRLEQERKFGVTRGKKPQTFRRYKRLRKKARRKSN